MTYPDGSAVTYAYDAANRLTTVTNWLGEEAVYAYDQDGRPGTSTQFNGITTTYSYDTASRLTAAASSISSSQFELDGDGNRIGLTETRPLQAEPTTIGSTAYTYGTQGNRLLSAGPMSYTYDSEGQLASSVIAGLGMTYTFDYDHRLAQIGTDTQFSYDGLGHRLMATRSGVLTCYIYDPWGNLVAVADESNNIAEKFIYGRGLLAMTTSSALYCYHFDPKGNTVALTDMTGTLVNSYAYGPFGEILAQQETVSQPFKFVGQYGVMAEPEGLYYMRARYYDPSVGRFISEDPLGFEGGDVNLYAYVQNNPVNLIDPHGLQIDTPIEGEEDLPGGMNGLIVGGNPSSGEVAPVLDVPGGGSIVPTPPADPTQSPGEGWEWRGQQPVGGDKGAWYNPNTGESLHPDLDHPLPIGPHWDYTDPEGKTQRLPCGN